jgi:iron-sulfur cluster insertion protein
MSIMHLIGMEIDYKKGIFGSILHIDNPNVTSSCGCGESFNVL